MHMFFLLFLSSSVYVHDIILSGYVPILFQLHVLIFNNFQIFGLFIFFFWFTKDIGVYFKKKCQQMFFKKGQNYLLYCLKVFEYLLKKFNFKFNLKPSFLKLIHSGQFCFKLKKLFWHVLVLLTNIIYGSIQYAIHIGTKKYFGYTKSIYLNI